MSPTAEAYRRWAEVEAHGSSAIYERWAHAVSRSSDLIELLDEVPADKRQPNLVFAAARWHGAPDSADDIVDWLIAAWPRVRSTILARSTQTNEPARCAALLFALALIDQPIALIEVGAAAGLCLIPDRYDYRYIGTAGEHHLTSPTGRHHLLIECAVEGTRPATRLPQIPWRAGMDLHPVDLGDPDERLWMETLIWPEHDDRRERLALAAEEWSADPPRVIGGDILCDLEALAAGAPRDCTVVVVHSAVLAYLSPSERIAAGQLMDAVADHRISLEGASVLPGIAAVLPPSALLRPGDFVLSLDGDPIGLSTPHGGRFEALSGRGL